MTSVHPMPPSDTEETSGSSFSSSTSLEEKGENVVAESASEERNDVPNHSSPVDGPNPGLISISGEMCPTLRALFSSWLLLSQNAETNEIQVQAQVGMTDWIRVMESFLDPSGDKNEEPSDSQANDKKFSDWVAVGEELNSLNLSSASLLSINDTICRGLPVGKVQDLLLLLEGEFTLVFKKEGADEWTKRAVIIKPQLQDYHDNANLQEEAKANTSSLCTWGTNLQFVRERLEEQTTEEVTGEEAGDESDAIAKNEGTIASSEKQDEYREEKKDQQQGDESDTKSDILDSNESSSNDSASPQSTLTMPFEKSTSTRTVLVLGPLAGVETTDANTTSRTPTATWLQQTPLAEGDMVLSVNGKESIQELDANDAMLLVASAQMHSPFLSLLVQTPPSKRTSMEQLPWRRRLRKAAVAVGGGTLFSVGAVLMVTPLHPIGHAMAIGGVGVLGTEFEQPKRAVRRASAGFVKLAGNIRQSWKGRQRRSSATSNSATQSTCSVLSTDSTLTTSTTTLPNDDDSQMSATGAEGEIVERKEQLPIDTIDAKERIGV